MNEVTRILSAIEQGDPHAAEQAPAAGYEELRKLAAERLSGEARRDAPGHGTRARGYLRLVDREKVQRWDSRGHFFAAAAEAIRHILVEKHAARDD